MDQAIADLTAMGVAVDLAESWIKGQMDEAISEPVEILPSNRPAWSLFAAVCNQWRSAGMGGLMGFDLVAVEVAARALGIRLDEDMLARLRVIETEALRIMKETQR